VKVIAVVGSASGSGKTRLACAILHAFPGLGAVKISPREGSSRVEWGGGKAGKDTAHFAQSGAAVVARVVAARERVPEVWKGMRGALEPLRGIVVEGAGALDIPAERFTVFVVSPESLGERPARDERLAAAADCIVIVRPDLTRVPKETPLVDRHRARIPVLSLSAGEENWADEVLLDAIRRFLVRDGGVMSPPLLTRGMPEA
jgi:hypothetical protein